MTRAMRVAAVALGTWLLGLAGIGGVTGGITMAQPAPTDASLVAYRVKPHDTLYALARQYLLRMSDYLAVQTLNHIRTPTYLAPDTVLHIPMALLRTASVTAQLVSFRGDVRVDGRVPQVGAALAEGARLETGIGSFATIRSVDGSVISMPSLSAMRLAHMRRVVLTGGLDQEYAVERGRISTEVAPQNPDSHYRFRTPIAVSAVRGTVFRVAYGDGPSLTEVLGGTVLVGKPGSGNPLPVPRGVGAAVSPTGGIGTEALLPPPALVSPGMAQAGSALRFAFNPVPGAVAYHAQVALDAAFHQILAETTGAPPEADFAALADGHYFLRATAISAAGFEGLPAVTPFDRQLVMFDAQASQVTARLYRFAWTYNGPPAHYYFQLMPVGYGPDGPGLHLNHPDMTATAITVENAPPGLYRWRVGAITRQGNGSSTIVWTPFHEIELAR